MWRRPVRFAGRIRTGDELMTDTDTERVARIAATAAAEVVAKASEAAMLVSATAAQAAHTLAATTQNDVSNIKEHIREIKALLDKKYVTYDVFNPVKQVVYGLVALILTSVIAGLLTLVLRQP
jgi:Trk K+ transport system NAD-binding subunit